MTTVPPGSLVLGAAQFGQEYGNGPDRTAPSAEAIAEILRRAADLGIRDIDTARAYGGSEEAIGAAIADLPDLRIVTKVAPLSTLLPDAEPPRQQVEGAVRDSLSTSLAALGRDRIDALLLHRAADLSVGDGAAADALRSAVQDGVAARWGVSLSTPAELLDALREPGLGYVQLPFNMLDRRWLADEVQVALAGRPDVHITVRSALLQGLLVGSDPARWPAVAGVVATATIARLRGLAERFGAASLLELAIRYVRGHAFADAVVLGLRRPDQLAGLADAVSADPLDPDQLDVLHHDIAAAPLDLVDPSRWPRTIPAATPTPRSTR